MILSLIKRLAVAMALLFALGSAHAATPTTLLGTNFDIVYDASGLGLFGTPTLSGNTVFFTPTDFKAESLNGQGIVTANQTIVFDIVPHMGFTITGSLLTERGDYLLRHASSQVDVQGQTRGFAIANPLAEVNSNITATAPLTTLNVSTNWEANSFLNLSGLQADNRGYRITIENLLFAYTEAGSGPRQAFIEKKFAGETMAWEVVGAVPEPEQWAMLLVGLGLLGWTAHRRAKIAG